MILMMLCDLYERLGIKNAEINPELVKEAIISGNMRALQMEYRLAASETSEETMREACNIMDMWSFLELGYERLSEQEKSQVEKETVSSVQFPGFDSHGECEYISVVRFWTNQLDRWDSFKGRDLDSHSHRPTLDEYRRMLGVFEPLRIELSMRQFPALTADEIIKILNARRPAKQAASASDSGWKT